MYRPAPFAFCPNTTHLFSFILRIIIMSEYLRWSPLEKYIKVYLHQLNLPGKAVNSWRASLRASGYFRIVRKCRCWQRFSFYVSNALCGFGIFRVAYANFCGQVLAWVSQLRWSKFIHDTDPRRYGQHACINTTQNTLQCSTAQIKQFGVVLSAMGTKGATLMTQGIHSSKVFDHLPCVSI